AGTLTNEAEGKLIGTGPNSNLTAEAVRNDGSGRISGFSAIETAGDADHGADASIEGPGAGATFTVGGNLTTDGTISQIESLLVDDTITNGGYITGTGANSKVTANSLKNSSGASVSGYSDAEFYSVDNDGTIEGTGLDSKFTAAVVENNADAVISGYSDVEVSGLLTNAEGAAISGTREGSVYQVGTINNNGSIDQVEEMAVKWDAENKGSITGTSNLSVARTLFNLGKITAAGEGSTYKIGTLENGGSIEDVEQLIVKNDITNDGAITGTGDESKLKAANLTNNIDGTIDGFAAMNVAGIVNNKGGITASGEDSSYKIGELNNDGTIDNVEAMVVTGNVANNGDINGTGDNSKFTAANLDNSADASITGYSNMTVAGIVNNDGQITSTGEDSTYKLGVLNNNGAIDDVEAMVVTGDAVNNGEINGTGANSKFTAANLANNENAQITAYSNMNVAGTVTNAAGALMRASGTGSVYSCGELANSGTIEKLESLVVGGAVTNSGDGTIDGTGANSKFTAATLDNNDNGVIRGFSDMSIDGGVNNADNAKIIATGENSAYKIGGDLNNYGDVEGTEALVVDGSVDNYGDGRITGTGSNSKLTAAGLNNYDEGTVENFSDMNIAGDLFNADNASITATGENSSYKIGGDLDNHGTINQVEALTVDGSVTNNGDGQIVSTGANSKFTANALDNNGSGEIRDFSDMDVTGAVNNADNAKITATGPNSTYKMGELNNHGEVADIEALIVNGNVNNFDDGRIIGSGSNSRLDADNLNNNNEGCVEDFSDINIAGNVFNAVKGTIKATGENSSYKIGGRLDNYGVVNNIEALTVDGDINNYGDGTYNGLIIGTGANSKINAANLNNNTYGIVHKFSDMDVTGKVFNADQATISGSGANSAYKMGTLENHGVIGGVEAITVAGGATNDGSGTIVGTGDNSKFDADTLDNLGSGRIWSFSDMNVTGPVNNAADAAIVATGEGSSYKMGELNNGGLVAEAESVTVSGNINNYGDGTIVGTGDNSKLAAENLYNNDTAAVIDYSNVNVSGQVVNAADALIRGAGESSSFKAGELDNSGLLDSVEEIDVEGTITNRENGSILEVGANSTLKAGNITNNGVISATADPDADTSVGIYSSMDVDGDLVNAGPDPDQSLTQWKAAAHPNAEGQDDRENKRPDTPAMQTLAEDLSGAAKIVNYSNMSVGGTLTNAASGYIRATGVGSTYTLGTLDNSGVLTGVENLNVANNLTNLGGGLIQGTGVGSTLNVGGNLDINFGSTIRHYETVNVGGDLNNLGTMEFISDTYVGGSFLNQSNTYVPPTRTLRAAADAGGIENATGGMLVTDTYNGRIGKITVQGDAVINGGELWIGGSGEQLRVGQDYVFLTVNDGHLTVNEALKIRASNEYDYDTLLDDNYDTGSSNKTKSATPRLFHAEGFYNDTDYYVSLRRDFVYGRTGVTSNQKNVGTYLDSLAYTLNSANDNYSEGDLFNVLSALDNENINGGNVPDSDYGYSNGKGEYTYVSNYATEGALKALDQLSGAIYADMAMMSRQNLWIVQNHLADFLRPDFCLECNCACGPINNGCGCGCDAAGFCTACEDTLGDCVTGAGHNFWGMYYGNFGEIESDGNAGDFDYKTNGFIIGGDLYRSHRTRVGIYGAYGYTSLDRNGLDNSSKTQSYNVGLYGVHEFCFGNLLGTAGITRDNFKADRLLHFGESPLNSNYVHRMHHGELQSTQYNVRLEQSWNYALRRTLFQPVIGVAYDHLRMSDLQESTEWGDREDGQYVTELHSDGYNLDSLRSDIGLRLSRCCTHGSSAFSLQGRAAWIHEFADTNVEITNSFTNRNYDVEETGYGNAYNTEANNAFNSDQFNTCSYTIRGVDLGRDYAWGGAGLTYTCLNSNISLFAAYDILFNDLERLHNVSGGAEFSW
ncbi:MAG: autotransporter domain-containing protein, partial [Thermoguttaceae bacterium]|nr:autotransporter domain-containing protein [Thermoguttaceae bacterium]